MKSLFYCHHSVGIGHLVRTVRLAEASLHNGPVLLMSGGTVPPRLPIDSGIRIVQLPPLRMNSDNTLVDASGDANVDKIFENRKRIAVETIRDFLPDVVVVEMFPFGRKKFADEVSSIIETARENHGVKVISSVRDVLVTKRRDQDRHDLRAVTSLNENFDALLIHSDPKLISLDATFSTFEEIAIPTFYTGYIGGSRRHRESKRLRRIVVSAGGGRVGHELIDIAMAAHSRIKQELNLDMLLVTGPNGKRCRIPANGADGPTAVEFIDNMPRTLAESMVSVSQCGYNTAVDVLKTGTPAIFVPYETASEDEQLRRADQLCRKGYAVLLRQQSLTADSLLDAVSKALSTEQANIDINLDGAARSGELIREVGHRA